MRIGTRWLLAGGAAVVLAGTVAAVVLTIPAGTAPPSCEPAAVASPSGPATDRSGITVVEQGHSVLAEKYPRVSMGAVVHNNSDRTAYRTQVLFDVLGPDGEPVVSGPRASYATVEVPIIPPGSRVAVGNLMIADERARVDRISITTAVTEWLPPGSATNGLAPITATVIAGSGVQGGDGYTGLRFTTTSANCTDLFARGTGVVWRNSAGKIIGGFIGDEFGFLMCRAGGSSEPLSVGIADQATPVGIDLDRTEISPYCDLQTPPRGGIPIAPFSPVG